MLFRPKACALLTISATFGALLTACVFATNLYESLRYGYPLLGYPALRGYAVTFLIGAAIGATFGGILLWRRRATALPVVGALAGGAVCAVIIALFADAERLASPSVLAIGLVLYASVGLAGGSVARWLAGTVDTTGEPVSGDASASNAVLRAGDRIGAPARQAERSPAFSE